MIRTEYLVQSLMDIAQAVSSVGPGAFMQMNHDVRRFSSDEILKRISGGMLTIEIINRGLPKSAYPIVMSCQKDGSMDVSIGGIPVLIQMEEGYKFVLRSLQLIEMALPEKIKEGQADFYVIGHEGHLNANEALASFQARHPSECVMKLMLLQNDDFLDVPERQISYAPDDIEIRTRHDWKRIDVARHQEQATGFLHFIKNKERNLES